MYENGFDEKHDAFLIFSKFVPVVANDTVDSLAAKTFRVILLPLILLAYNNCAIDRNSCSLG